jgi:hypothetical protein
MTGFLPSNIFELAVRFSIYTIVPDDVVMRQNKNPSI